MVVYLHAQPPALFLQRGFGIGTPDAYSILSRVIIGKHEFGLFVPEFRSFKFILGISDFDAHLLQFQKAIIALLAGDILADAASPAAIVIDNGCGELFGGYFTGGVGDGTMPVVDS